MWKERRAGERIDELLSGESKFRPRFLRIPRPATTLRWAFWLWLANCYFAHDSSEFSFLVSGELIRWQGFNAMYIVTLGRKPLNGVFGMHSIIDTNW